MLGADEAINNVYQQQPLVGADEANINIYQQQPLVGATNTVEPIIVSRMPESNYEGTKTGQPIVVSRLPKSNVEGDRSCYNCVYSCGMAFCIILVVTTIIMIVTVNTG